MKFEYKVCKCILPNGSVCNYDDIFMPGTQDMFSKAAGDMGWGYADNTPGYNMSDLTAKYGSTLNTYKVPSIVNPLGGVNNGIVDTSQWTVPNQGYGTASGYMPQAQASSFSIPSEFAQANPVAQKASGSIGGQISGPANPYNNGQFVNQTANPLDTLVNNWKRVFGDIGKGSVLSGLLGTTKAAGVGVGPTMTTALNNAGTPTTPTTTTPTVPGALVTGTPNIPSPGPMTVNSPEVYAALQNETNNLTQAIFKSGGEIDSTAVMKAAPQLLKLAQENPTEFKQLVNNNLNDESTFAVVRSLLTMPGYIPLSQDGKSVAYGSDGKILADPIITEQKWATIKDPAVQGWFWDTFSVDRLPCTPYFDSTVDAYQRMRLFGLAVSNGYYGEQSPTVIFEMTKGELISGSFAHKLREMGYSNDAIKYAQNKASAVIFANEPEAFQQARLRGERWAQEGMAPGVFTVEIASLLRTVPYEKAVSLLSDLNNMANATRPGGVLKNLNIAGHDYPAGQAIIEMEKMTKGDVELVPEKDTRGDYTGRWTTKNRTFGFLEQRAGAQRDNELGVGGGSGEVTPTQLSALQKAWKKSGTSLTFEDWIASFQSGAAAIASTNTSSSTRSRRGRLRSVSY